MLNVEVGDKNGGKTVNAIQEYELEFHVQQDSYASISINCAPKLQTINTGITHQITNLCTRN